MFITGPSVPVAANSLESTVTSFSTVNISWTVSRVTYTQETYTVVYGINRSHLNERSSSVNGTLVTTSYSAELTWLRDSTQYYYQVESTNTVGSTYSEVGHFEIQNACKDGKLSSNMFLIIIMLQ